MTVVLGLNDKKLSPEIFYFTSIAAQETSTLNPTREEVQRVQDPVASFTLKIEGLYWCVSCVCQCVEGKGGGISCPLPPGLPVCEIMRTRYLQTNPCFLLLCWDWVIGCINESYCLPCLASSLHSCFRFRSPYIKKSTHGRHFHFLFSWLCTSENITGDSSLCFSTRFGFKDGS